MGGILAYQRKDVKGNLPHLACQGDDLQDVEGSCLMDELALAEIGEIF